MKRVFIPEITLGHVIQICGMMITIVALYYKMDARISRLEEMFKVNIKMVEVININQTALIRTVAILEERTKNAK
jgi:hypothetical protein